MQEEIKIDSVDKFVLQALMEKVLGKDFDFFKKEVYIKFDIHGNPYVIVEKWEQKKYLN